MPLPLPGMAAGMAAPLPNTREPSEAGARRSRSPAAAQVRGAPQRQLPASASLAISNTFVWRRARHAAVLCAKGGTQWRAVTKRARLAQVKRAAPAALPFGRGIFTAIAAQARATAPRAMPACTATATALPLPLHATSNWHWCQHWHWQAG